MLSSRLHGVPHAPLRPRAPRRARLARLARRVCGACRMSAATTLEVRHKPLKDMNIILTAGRCCPVRAAGGERSREVAREGASVIQVAELNRACRLMSRALVLCCMLDSRAARAVVN